MNKVYSLLFFLLVCSTAVQGAIFTVTNTNNAGAGSLRQAVQDAAAGDSIRFQTGLSGTIVLASEIVINKNLTIDGGNAAGGMMTISGGSATRIFNVTAGNVRFFNLILENASVTGSGGAILVGGAGNTITIDTCTLRNNTASVNGGALHVALGCTLDVRNTTLSGNTRAMSSAGSVTATNVTMSNNTGAQALDLQSGGGATLINCTVFDNPTTNENLLVQTGVTLTANNSIFQSARLTGGTINANYCLFLITPNVVSGSFSPSQTIIGFNALLGPLANNGGKTQTKALFPGSPAWRAGTSTGAPVYDQRGVVRPTHPSMGAFDSDEPVKISVLNNADDGVGSLRRTVSNALEGDSLIFNPLLTGQTITLTSGEIVIDKSIVIQGLGANNLAISGNNASRIFRTSAGPTNRPISDFQLHRHSEFVGLKISDITLRNGRSTSASENGLGILCTGTLEMNNCEIRDCENTAGGDGAGVYVTLGIATMSNCTFTGNTCASGSSGGALTVENFAFVTVANCTFSNNSAAQGGAIATLNDSFCEVISCTIASNSATIEGGGVYQTGSNAMLLTNTIIAGNTAPTAPDIRATFTPSNTPPDMRLFTIGAETMKTRSHAKWASHLYTVHNSGQRYNLIGNGAGLSGIVNGDGDSNLVGTVSNPIDPNLGALANNGGSVRTRALNSGSPAINKGNPNPTENSLATDQRGGSFVRVSNGRMDIGAFEVQATSGTIVRDPVGSDVTLPESGTGITVQLGGVESTGFLERIRFNLAAPNLNAIASIAATPQTGGAFIPNKVSPERYWTISNSSILASITLNIDLTGIGGIINPNRLLIVRRASLFHLWEAVNTTQAGGILSAQFSPSNFYGDFAIASLASENPLPVELSSFRASQENERVVLKWTTASEKNNAGFEVQRRSENRGASNEDWQVLGFVRGKGTTSEANSYSFADRTAIGRVQYRLKQVDFDGAFEYSPLLEVDAGMPKIFELSQNYPNPFNPTTVISYQLPVASEVSIKVFDMLGREVATLVNKWQEAGRYQVTFNAVSLSSSVYFYRLQAGNFVQTKKMLLIK